VAPDKLRDKCPNVDAEPGEVVIPLDVVEAVGVKPLLDEEPFAHGIAAALDVPQRQATHPQRSDAQTDDDREVGSVALETAETSCQHGPSHAGCLPEDNCRCKAGSAAVGGPPVSAPAVRPSARIHAV